MQIPPQITSKWLQEDMLMLLSPVDQDHQHLMQLSLQNTFYFSVKNVIDTKCIRLRHHLL